MFVFTQAPPTGGTKRRRQVGGEEGDVEGDGEEGDEDKSEVCLSPFLFFSIPLCVYLSLHF